MGSHDLPDKYALSPRACGPRSSAIHIRQIPQAHVTTTYFPVKPYIKDICMMINLTSPTTGQYLLISLRMISRYHPRKSSKESHCCCPTKALINYWYGNKQVISQVHLYDILDINTHRPTRVITRISYSSWDITITNCDRICKKGSYTRLQFATLMRNNFICSLAMRLKFAVTLV